MKFNGFDWSEREYQIAKLLGIDPSDIDKVFSDGLNSAIVQGEHIVGFPISFGNLGISLKSFLLIILWFESKAHEGYSDLGVDMSIQIASTCSHAINMIFAEISRFNGTERINPEIFDMCLSKKKGDA